MLIDAIPATWLPWLGLALLAGLFVLFASERVPPAVAALATASLMALIGMIDARELLSAFANPAPVTIGAMFVLSGALIRTGVIEAVASFVASRARRRPAGSLATLFGGTFLASSLINNTPVVLLMIPIIRKAASVTGIAATRLLIPLSYFSILGGGLTLIGTSTNLLVDGVGRDLGQPAFGIFEITGVGLAAALAGTAVLLLGRWLLPDRPETDSDDGGDGDLYLTEITIGEDSDLIGQTIAQAPAFRPANVTVRGIRHGVRIHRDAIGDHVLGSGDRLVVTAPQEELQALSRRKGLIVGLPGAGVQPGISPRPASRIVELALGSSHPAVGRQLRTIPFLSRLPVTVLGLSRPRHVAGPSLADARLHHGDRLLVDADEGSIAMLRDNIHLVDIRSPARRPYRRAKAPLAITTLLTVIGLAAIGLAPIELLAIAGVAVVLVTRCIDSEEAWSSLDGGVLALIIAMLAIGAGLANAGTVDLLVAAMLPAVAGAPFLVLLLAIYALTSLLTEIVTNNAVAVLMTPIVIALAAQLGFDPRPLMIAVMFGASASFATPIGYQTNTIVYSAGNYRFADFLRVGVPMNIAAGLAACLAIAAIYPV